MSRRTDQSTLLAAAIAISLSGSLAYAADTVDQQHGDTWRASKLVGVSIYGPDSKSVGKIDDVIMSKDGKSQLVVVGVGGFLGIGQKAVAIPFDQVKFTDQPVKPTQTSTDSAGINQTQPGLGAPPADGMSANPPNGSGSTAKQGAYPDHGTIDMTYDQLKSAPDFKFAT